MLPIFLSLILTLNLPPPVPKARLVPFGTPFGHPFFKSGRRAVFVNGRDSALEDNRKHKVLVSIVTHLE